jgi:hypothetical protein
MELTMSDDSKTLGSKISEGAKEGVGRAVATIVHYKIVGLVAVGAVVGFFAFNVPGMIAGFLWDRTAGAAIEAGEETLSDAFEAAKDTGSDVFNSAKTFVLGDGSPDDVMSELDIPLLAPELVSVHDTIVPEIDPVITVP